MFTVEYYEKEDGTFPVEQFILGLDNKMQAKVFRLLNLLEEFGNQLSEPHSKHLEEGIYELRIKQSSNTNRVLYFFFAGKRIILTNGFVKKTQKTPRNEIELAKRRKQLFYERERRNLTDAEKLQGNAE